jgi:hypothetical protein
MILECGHEPSEHSEFTTGYGVKEVNGKDFRCCYECCAKDDRDSMLSSGRATLYLDMNPRKAPPFGYSRESARVTNWPGSLEFWTGPVRKGRHNIAGRRYDVWFTGPDGKDWHGVQYGENTQICHCRRTKSRA